MTKGEPPIDAQLAGFLEMVPGAILCVVSNGAIVCANAAAAGLFGYERGALMNVQVELLLKRSYSELVSRQESATQLAARRKDGVEFAAEVLVTLTQVDGRPVVTIALRDVSERGRDHATFRGVVEGSDDAAVAMDSGGRIARVNAEAEELFGYASSELIDHSIDMLVPQTSQSITAPVGSRRGPGQASEPLEVGSPLEGRRKDGSEFPVEISLSALETSDGPLISAAIRDASDRTVTRREEDRAKIQRSRDLLETRLHQSHRLESLGQLAGGVAHDFNNLLAAILNYSAFVSDGIEAELETRPVDARVNLTAVLSDVAQIGAAAERAAGLTHQLLSFARREVRNLEVLDINDIVGEVETLLRRTIGEHVTLVTRGAPDLKAVRADRGQIEQILLNLAVNARDAMPNGGTLSVATENFTVDEEYSALHPVVEAGSYVRLRVTDTGAGMDRETLDQAFEPFFSTKAKDKGTGLGLATVYGIVSQMAGLVELDSKAGAGTSVTILLPTVVTAVTEPVPPRHVTVHQAGETVLVVEDEEPVLDVTSRILAQHGYHVLVARSGAEAFAVLEDHSGSIDLLLTDVVMPGITGKEIAERVSELRPAIRVLYMSGYPELVVASQGVVGQGIRLLSKPFKALELLDRVRAVLDA
ncbi:MAG: PAS domain S-box protein [Candidatus Dormiibacterota bacterium]